MLRTILLPVTLSLSSISYGSCQLDSPEIGDAGPDSQRVCDMLESRSESSDITILDRKVHSARSVSVIIELDDQLRTLEYELSGADWKVAEPALAGHQ